MMAFRFLGKMHTRLNMDELREKLRKVLAEHQRESGLHMVGGCEKLIQRLLQELRPAPLGQAASERNLAEPNGGCP
jgi:hypothetical protein